jgi:hypothetical protein
MEEEEEEEEGLLTTELTLVLLSLPPPPPPGKEGRWADVSSLPAIVLGVVGVVALLPSSSPSPPLPLSAFALKSSLTALSPLHLLSFSSSVPWSSSPPSLVLGERLLRLL